MGDSRRFNLFAKLIEKHIRKDARIADVASGKGYLKAELYRLGYKKVTCWDKRRKLARGRAGQKYQYFDYKNAPRDYNAVVAMHPDEATDHVILYAVKHQIPALICPCCIKPSATTFNGNQSEHDWLLHLKRLAYSGNSEVIETSLPISGKNHVLILKPKRRH